MKLILNLFTATLASLFVAGSAQATMVAGWDFSQYFGAGFLTTDGATFSNTLNANYSDFDPTFNAGAESAAFGILLMDGSFGSTNVAAGSGSEEVIPFTGSLSNNLDAPVLNPFDSHTILASEGQVFTSLLSLGANQAASIVFQADLSSTGLQGDAWELSFAGRTLSGTSDVGVEVAFDGGSFATLVNQSLTTTDTLFTVDLGSTAATTVQIRMAFDPQGIDFPLIDNVAVSAANIVPEPGTGLLVTTGLLGLAAMGRRRS